ncbi:gliding motility-associated C-terminal domain-containing protein [Flavobacterium sp.]|uniref:gliding motility-associated C-terminal domain-containing protein n=1 Tax=Flavobacterium sp. TaxID=239 RepID=UPI003D2CC764
MIKKITLFLFLFYLLIPEVVFSQDISLYTQINGRYDFTFVGNTLNTNENSFMSTPTILTSSSADLNLGPTDVIERAYLYWAGCGTGDFDVQLNGVDITPDRTFSIIQTSSGWPHFSAFKDITAQVQATGNGTYTLSDLDLTAEIPQYFQNRTNFGGWAIIVVYQNDALPLNQLNIYDGMQAVPSRIDISLNSLNVIDNFDAKIGFLAWEGDVGIANNESLTINGNVLSNPPLNPSNNAFNSTNSVTGSNTLYNMDLDIYNIQNNINVGDTTADISLTSNQDYVMINAIVTKLNSQLPDATIVLNNYTTECNTGVIEVDYTVYNVNSTEFLPANTPITFYIQNTFLGTFFTQNDIPIGGNENGSVTLNIPSALSTNFTLLAVVDDNGNGLGIVTELVETNNTFEASIDLKVSPTFNFLDDLLSCNLGLTRGIFDFSSYEELVKSDSSHSVTFHENYNNAVLNSNEIFNTTNYEAVTTPKEIFVRIENEFCYSITSFNLLSRNCPPEVFNAVSANNDGLNDGFFIEGLRDIFINFKLEIYNRWGRHIWTGDNSIPDWDGKVAKSVGPDDAPEGTYYYILYLNDPDYTEPLTGYLYLTR